MCDICANLSLLAWFLFDSSSSCRWHTALCTQKPWRPWTEGRHWKYRLTRFNTSVCLFTCLSDLLCTFLFTCLYDFLLTCLSDFLITCLSLQVTQDSRVLQVSVASLDLMELKETREMVDFLVHLDDKVPEHTYHTCTTPVLHIFCTYIPSSSCRTARCCWRYWRRRTWRLQLRWRCRYRQQPDVTSCLLVLAVKSVTVHLTRTSAAFSHHSKVSMTLKQSILSPFSELWNLTCFLTDLTDSDCSSKCLKSSWKGSLQASTFLLKITRNHKSQSYCSHQSKQTLKSCSSI